MNGFDDMVDDLAEVMRPTPAAGTLPAELDIRDFRSAPMALPEFKERCAKCGGLGKFTSWSGRVLGNCFACNGLGHRAFKTSPDQRASARVAKVKREAKNLASQIAEFDAANPGVRSWLTERAPRWDFADSLLAGLARYGGLTSAQTAKVAELMARDTIRTAQQAQRAESAPAADVSKIEQAFEAARAAGLKRIGVRLAGLKFKPAPAAGRNPGAVYVTDVAGEYLGKVLGGRLFASRECSDERAAEIIAAAADPLAAAVAYGKEFGACSICNRELTDPESIAAGIGPVCARKYGW